MPYEVKGPMDCHIWTGRTDDHGTPIIRTRKGCTTARRYHYEREIGPVPKGKILMAACRNALCVRSSHADPVTPREFAYRIGLSKLDPEKAATALRMRGSGHSRAATARHFNVHPDTIKAVEDGTHWTQRKEAIHG